MKTIQTKAFFILWMLWLSSFGCRLVGEANPPNQSVPIRTEAAVVVNEKLEQAAREAKEKGIFTLVLTEQELTSYIVLNWDESWQIPVTDLQIRLAEEQIWISGIVQQDKVHLPLSIRAKVGVDSVNDLRIEFTHAQIGALPIPDLLLETIMDEVEQAIKEQLTVVGEEYVIEEISIGEGSILIRGIKR